MVAGIIIGASIFVQRSEITRHVPAAGGMAAVALSFSPHTRKLSERARTILCSCV